MRTVGPPTSVKVMFATDMSSSYEAWTPARQVAGRRRVKTRGSSPAGSCPWMDAGSVLSQRAGRVFEASLGLEEWNETGSRAHALQPSNDVAIARDIDI